MVELELANRGATGFQQGGMAAIRQFNPYKLEAGRDLDALVHRNYFSDMGEEALPQYSVETNLAENVLAKLQTKFKLKVVTGRTKHHRNKWFARLDTGPSTSTEAWGETRALAICRLAAVLASKV